MVEISHSLRRLPVSPRTGLTVVLVSFAFLCATGLYLFDTGARGFDDWPLLGTLSKSLAPIRVDGLSGSVLLQHGPDMAWAAAMAMVVTLSFARYFRNRAMALAIVIFAACSWELAQGLEWAPGVFDPLDLLVSCLAAMIVWVLLNAGRPRRGSTGEHPS